MHTIRTEIISGNVVIATNMLVDSVSEDGIVRFRDGSTYDLRTGAQVMVGDGTVERFVAPDERIVVEDSGPNAFSVSEKVGLTLLIGCAVVGIALSIVF